ncbi:hypothetical protein D3C75_938410 [compost metagenome]
MASSRLISVSLTGNQLRPNSRKLAIHMPIPLRIKCNGQLRGGWWNISIITAAVGNHSGVKWLDSADSVRHR